MTDSNSGWEEAYNREAPGYLNMGMQVLGTPTFDALQVLPLGAELILISIQPFGGAAYLEALTVNEEFFTRNQAFIDNGTPSQFAFAIYLLPNGMVPGTVPDMTDQPEPPKGIAP